LRPRRLLPSPHGPQPCPPPGRVPGRIRGSRGTCGISSGRRAAARARRCHRGHRLAPGRTARLGPRSAGAGAPHRGRAFGGRRTAPAAVPPAIASGRAELPGWGLGRRARETRIVSGHSAGGCLVLGWASHLPEAGPRIRLRPLAPVTDLLREVAGGLADGAVLDYMGKTPEDDPAAYLRHDPRSRAALIPSRVEVLSIHGDADGIVDIGFSRVFPAARTEL